MSSEAERVVRAHFEAANRREFANVMATYAPDVMLVNTTTGLLSGTHRGSEAVGRYFGDWLGTFGHDAHFDLLEVKGAGAAVAVVARHRATGTISGVTVDTEFFYAYWVTDGLIARVEMHDTRDAVFKAAGVKT